MPELVVIAEQLLAPVPGGTGRYTGELLRALARTTPEGWTVSSVVARHDDVEAARIDGVGGPRTLPLGPKALTMAWQLGLPLWPGGDTVHAPTPLAPARAPRGRALAVTVHDTVPWTHPDTLTPRGVSWHRQVIGRATRRADAVVVPTAAVANRLHAHVPGRVEPHIVGHGVSEALADGPTDLPTGGPAMPGLPERFVLAVGTLEPRKGIDLLIEAMAGIDDVPLLLAGQRGWGELDPVAIARRHGLAEHRLRVLGRLSDAELGTTMRAATVLAVPSLAEGFGLPLLEGMAAGAPVVHSDDPALVEVAGGAGLIVARNDVEALQAGLRTVLTEPERAAAMTVAGRRRASAFSWNDAAARIWNIHRELHAAHRRGGAE